MKKTNILDVTKVSGTKIKLRDYTHIRAYYASRTDDEQMFRTQGLKPYTREEALVDAVKKLESNRVSRRTIEKSFDTLWEECCHQFISKVWLTIEKEVLLTQSNHYLLYGSEFLNMLAAGLFCREKLKTIGKPMIVVCNIPLGDISSCWLEQLERCVETNDTTDYSIAVNKVAPENVIDVLYPTGIVRDPFTR